MNVEVIEVGIVLEKGWELSPRSLLVGVKAMNKDNQLVALRILSYSLSQLFSSRSLQGFRLLKDPGTPDRVE